MIAEKKENDLFIKSLSESSITACVDKSGNFISVNNRFCESSGYDREELIGINFKILKSGYHNKNFYDQMWSKILNGEIWVGEICNKKKDGTLYWCHGSIIPILNDNRRVEKFFTIRQDVTVKKNLENQLSIFQKLMEDNLEWNRNVINSISRSIIVTDSRGTIIVFNKEAQKLFGYTFQEVTAFVSPVMFFSSEELMLQSIRLSDRFLKSIEPNFEALVAVARHNGRRDESEWRLYKKDRTIFSARVDITPILNKKNECTCFLFLIQDISIEKLLRQQLLDMKEIVNTGNLN